MLRSIAIQMGSAALQIVTDSTDEAFLLGSVKRSYQQSSRQRQIVPSYFLCECICPLKDRIRMVFPN